MRSKHTLLLCGLLPIVTACQPPQASQSTAASSQTPSAAYLRADLAIQVRSNSGVIRCGEESQVPGAITLASENEIVSNDPDVEISALKSTSVGNDRVEAIFEANDQKVVTYMLSSADEVAEAFRQRDECLSDLLAKISAEVEPESEIDVENRAAFAKSQILLSLQKQQGSNAPYYTGAIGALATVGGTYAAYKPKAAGLKLARDIRTRAQQRFAAITESAGQNVVLKDVFRPSPKASVAEATIAKSTRYIRTNTTKIAAVGVGLATLAYAAYKVHKAMSASDLEKFVKSNDRLAELVAMEDDEFREHVALFPEDGKLVIDAQARL